MSVEARRILVAVNGSEFDRRAIELACGLLGNTHTRGTIYLLHVIEVGRSEPLDSDVGEEFSRGEKILKATEQLARELKVHVVADVRQAREAGLAVVQEAIEREVELIVIALPYKRRFGEFTLGSAAPYVLRHSPCGVIVWRSPSSERQTAAVAH